MSSELENPQQSPDSITFRSDFRTIFRNFGRLTIGTFVTRDDDDGDAAARTRLSVALEYLELFCFSFSTSGLLLRRREQPLPPPRSPGVQGEADGCRSRPTPPDVQHVQGVVGPPALQVQCWYMGRLYVGDVHYAG